MKRLRRIPNDVFKRLILLEIQNSSWFNFINKLFLNSLFYIALLGLLILSRIEYLIFLIVIIVVLVLFMAMAYNRQHQLIKRLTGLIKQNKDSFLKQDKKCFLK